jgi:hypothetical protein
MRLRARVFAFGSTPAGLIVTARINELYADAQNHLRAAPRLHANRGRSRAPHISPIQKRPKELRVAVDNGRTLGLALARRIKRLTNHRMKQRRLLFLRFSRTDPPGCTFVRVASRDWLRRSQTNAHSNPSYYV